jgi:signal transduction histidine kinase
MAVKEAIHNSIKHAKASEVTISVEFSEATLTVSVRDNGCGFFVGNGHVGNGLKNIKHRLQDLGGSCVIESTLGAGTNVRLQVPINPINSLSQNTWTI